MSFLKSRGLNILCLILLLFGSFIIGYLLCPKKAVVSEETIEKIDSLESKIDSIYIIKESIQERIDTIYVKLEENNKQYEKDFNNILNNDANEDFLFFLNYIDSNRARLDSISKGL